MALIALSAYSLQAYNAGYDKEDWQAAAQHVAAEAEAGDLVIFSAPWVQIPFDYYYPKEVPAIARHGAPADLFSTGELEPAMTDADVPALRALVGERQTVWLVYAHEWYSDPGGLILNTLEHDIGSPAAVHELLGVRVYRLTR